MFVLKITIKEFIEDNYDVRDRIRELKRDPIAELLSEDMFPYDFIGYDPIDKENIKMLYYDNCEKEIPVLELLSYVREDIVKMGDVELLKLYDVYISNFTSEGKDILSMDKLKLIREKYLEESKNRAG